MNEFASLGDLAAQEESPESPLDVFAAKHRELAAIKDVDIPIPGYDKAPPILMIRYRLIEGSEAARMGDKIKRETKDQWQRQILMSVDTFITTCVGFYFDDGSGKARPLTYNGEHLVRFDRDLAEALGFADELPDEITARKVAFSLFNNNDAAIVQHSQILNAWFADTSLDVQADLMGNP